MVKALEAWSGGGEGSAELLAAAARQIMPGETVKLSFALKDQHVAVTDRRLVIAKMGSFFGERAESAPLGAIIGVDTNVSDERVTFLQITVHGRNWMLFGDDLGPLLAALLRCLPIYGKAH